MYLWTSSNSFYLYFYVSIKGNIHKWFFTPRGCGYLWIDPSYTSTIKPSVVSHFHGVGLHKDFCVRGTRDDTAYYTIGEALSFCNSLGGWVSKNIVLILQNRYICNCKITKFLTQCTHVRKFSVLFISIINDKTHSKIDKI